MKRVQNGKAFQTLREFVAKHEEEFPSVLHHTLGAWMREVPFDPNVEI